jgi:hypothetical protein
MPRNLEAKEKRRLQALGERLVFSSNATAQEGSESEYVLAVRMGELMQGAIFAALEAVYPGRQKKKQLVEENDRACKAVLRFLARRTKRPNPHGF